MIQTTISIKRIKILSVSAVFVDNKVAFIDANARVPHRYKSHIHIRIYDDTNIINVQDHKNYAGIHAGYVLSVNGILQGSYHMPGRSGKVYTTGVIIRAQTVVVGKSTDW